MSRECQWVWLRDVICIFNLHSFALFLKAVLRQKISKYSSASELILGMESYNAQLREDQGAWQASHKQQWWGDTQRDRIGSRPTAQPQSREH